MATDGQRLVQRRIAQVDGDGLVAEVRIEHDADVGELADGREDVAALASRKISVSGSVTSVGTSAPGMRRSEARSMSASSVVLLAALGRDLRPQLRAQRRGARLRWCRSAGFSSDGELIFDERLFELTGGAETPRPG